jgi:hypothetical protein
VIKNFTSMPDASLDAGDSRQWITPIERCCNVRIESVLLDVNENRITGSS